MNFYFSSDIRSCNMYIEKVMEKLATFSFQVMYVVVLQQRANVVAPSKARLLKSWYWCVELAVLV